MKKQSKAIYGALIAFAILAAPFAADARPFGPGSHGGYGMVGNQLPQEKLEQLYAMRQEHRAAMQPLTEQLWSKQSLLEALSRNPKTDPKELTALVNEISDIRAKINQERDAFAAKAQKETGYAMPCEGYGMRGPGYGHHDRRGGGYHHGGYGRGCAW